MPSMGVAILQKFLILSSDHARVLAPDLKGLAVLSPHAMILVTDNDFGVEGPATRFIRVRYAEPVLA